MSSRSLRRLEALEEAVMRPSWHQGSGLANLLWYARHAPADAPPLDVDADAPLTGLVGVLRDARRYASEHLGRDILPR